MIESIKDLLNPDFKIDFQFIKNIVNISTFVREIVCRNLDGVKMSKQLVD